MIRHPPRSTLFPYPTLSRSRPAGIRKRATSRTSGGGLVAHIDGGARGNPGPAGYGVHVEDEEGRVVAQLFGYLGTATNRSEEHTSELQSQSNLVCRLLLEKK